MKTNRDTLHYKMYTKRLNTYNFRISTLAISTFIINFACRENNIQLKYLR